MALQYDINAGFDPSSLSSLTAAQFLQMIQQAEPLGNIGGIIYQNTAPDVANNPRFKRYIWLDTTVTTAPPVAKYYDIDESAGAGAAANWIAISISALSITNSEISATAEIEVSKLADGTANQVIRTDAAGTGVEWVTVSTLLAALNDAVPLTAIDDAAAVGAESFLRRVGSTVVWKTFTETVTAIQAALNGVAPTVITPGTNNTVMGTNGAGVVGFDTIDNILANLAISLTKISLGGASANDILRCDGTNWVKVTPSLRLVASDTANSGIDAGAMGGAAIFTVPHLLGGVPKLVRVVCRCNTIDNGYAVGDELELGALRIAASSFNSSSVSTDGTNVTVTLVSAAGNDIPNKGTGTYAVMTEASWNLIVYAWK